MKSALVWISNGRKEVGLQSGLILNGILNPEAQPFVIKTNGCHFFQKPFESRILNGDTIAIVEAIALLFVKI